MLQNTIEILMLKQAFLKSTHFNIKLQKVNMNAMGLTAFENENYT